jgi:iron complex transport system ATP-binding protein
MEQSFSEPLLRVVDLTAGFGPCEVFRDVSFHLRPGTITALIGPNGSGKTTLLHSLCSIHAEWTGSVTLLGESLRNLSRRDVARRVALVPQFTQIDFDVTVKEAVALGRYPYLGPFAPLSAQDRAAIDEGLRAMDLVALRSRNVNALSGGERQRVILARALTQRTRLLFLDEPAASLDLGSQQGTYALLRRFVKENEAAVLVCEHDLNLVAAHCDRVLILNAGRLRAEGRPGEIISEDMIRAVFGARMRIERTDEGIVQCLWRR